MLDKFIEAIPKIHSFTSKTKRPAMKASHFQLFFKILYYCALRVSEGIKLTKADFDIKHRIIRIRNPKTAKGKIQKTTIAPPILDELQSFLGWHKDDDQFFKMHRTTAQYYAKQAGIVAGLNIFDELEKRSIDGMYTHIFRKSYAKFMENRGAKPSLIMLKGRWKPMAVYQTYTKPSIMELLQWEEKVFSQLPYNKEV